MSELTRNAGTTSAPAADGVRRRPLLVNGEALRQTADPPGRGGGKKFKPYSVEENRARLLSVLRAVEDEAAGLPPGLRGDELVVVARLLPQFLAATSFPAALFSAAGLVPIGAAPDRASTRTRTGEQIDDVPTKSVYLAARDDLSGLRRVLEGTSGRLSKQAVEDVRALDTVMLQEATFDLEGAIVDEDGLAMFESVLHGRPGASGRAEPAGLEVTDRWAEFVRSLDGEAELDWTRTSGPVTFMPVRIAPDRAVEAARFNPLRAVQPMPRLRPLPDATADPDVFPYDRPRGARAPSARPLRVAVFDGGVDETSPYWQGRVRSVQVGALEPHGPTQRHGSVVTSALLYGRVDEGGLPEPADMVVDHYAAVPQAGRRPDLSMYWLLDVIEQQVRAHDYDVVTVCAAPQRLVTDGPVDRWTSTLDNLSHERGTLFVVAAGNNGTDPSVGGLNRILVPADATNVIAVGAADAARPRARRAAYSAVGPGRPGGHIRPSGVAFGGTPDDPFLAVNDDGTALQLHGTSCAAPLVVNGLAGLAGQLGERRLSAVNLRAFALHFARPCVRGQGLFDVGAGHFCDDYDFLRDGPANEAHVLYSGTIARHEFVPLSVPVPDGHASKLELRYTLVTSTATDSANGVDYTKAGLHVAFRPHANRYAMNKGRSNVVVDTRSDRAEIMRMLADGYRLAGEPATDSIGTAARTEAALRGEGKWESVRAGKHTYRDSAAKVHRPRLEISHLAREAGVLVADSPDLDWSLLVTLRADTGVQLYDAVRAQYRVLAALPAPTVPVRARPA